MIIGIWIVTVVSLVIIIGEIKYRCTEKRELIQGKGIVSEKWEDDVDVDLGKLSMEQTSDNFVYSQVLAMRGSWRLAQNQTMGKKTFMELRDEEYAKML